jgi:hypothetical protein
MARPYKFAHVDRAAIEQALSKGQSVPAAAQLLGMSDGYLYRTVRRLGIPLPPRQPQQAQPARTRRPPEQHPGTVQLVAEMESLRLQARLLVRRPGPRSTQELLAIEARHRALREQLRRAMGEPEASDTRLPSPAMGTLRPVDPWMW